MAAPVLVRAYTGIRGPAPRAQGGRSEVEAFPPISSYAFADILRTADCPDFQSAIDGIAEICAKNRMSLADEYASHLPPLGEITAATSVAAKPQLIRPSMRRPLTSVPEGSSGSSEGSRRSRKRSTLFSFRRQQRSDSKSVRHIRISSMGRTVIVASTVALTAGEEVHSPVTVTSHRGQVIRPQRPQRTASEALQSLQRLLAVTGDLRHG